MNPLDLTLKYPATPMEVQVNNNSDYAPFLGDWKLDPARSNYQSGQPPQSGLYRIEPEDNGLKITMDWVDAAGKSYQMSYFGIVDGKDYPYHDNPAVDAFSMTLVDSNRLDSAAKKDGRVVAHASRVLSADGQSMTVTQSGTDAAGQTYRNISIYLKE